MGIAAGFSLSDKCPVVVMQNSGLGNAINPLTSLQLVFNLPALLLISWRGEPGNTDEPEHLAMGPITPDLLNVTGIYYEYLTQSEEELAAQIGRINEEIKRTNHPAALIVREKTFKNPPEAYQETVVTDAALSRQEAIKIIVDNLGGEEAIVSTTGKISRELYCHGKESETNFYVVGSMGCALPIGFGIASQNSKKKVVVLDGDGAILMKMGSLATVGFYKPDNLIHLVLDNETYDSTGGQPTVSATVQLERVAAECGYATAVRVTTAEALRECLGVALKAPGPHCILVKVRPGADKNLGRPQLTPEQIKERFMNFLKEGE